ncbi:Transcriptional regulator, LysR family [hydrothermal vent metagenome]|uniref:Transcriptional regulator, LysR family n=1 Tax=hydrothermal vent metagenome TaxID=652676 RepID=A0A1W1EIB4_9ZZZZ
MNITLRQIEIFLNVVEVGHLTKVAKSMRLSQSAVSMSIKELESILNSLLFDRINKKLILNERGRAFKDEILPIFKKFRDVEYEFKNSMNKGMIRVGASTTIVDYLMPPIICSYMSSSPDVKITLKEGNSQKITQLIKDGKIDVGFIEGFANNSEIIQEIIGTDELIVVSADKTLIDEYSIKELERKRWVLREEGSGTRDVFLNYIKESSTNINIFLELGHTESIKSILLNHKCLTCISKLAVTKEMRENKLIKIDIKDFDCTRDLLMIYHKDKYHSELFNKFTNFAKSMIKSMLKDIEKVK